MALVEENSRDAAADLIAASPFDITTSISMVGFFACAIADKKC